MVLEPREPLAEVPLAATIRTVAFNSEHYVRAHQGEGDMSEVVWNAIRSRRYAFMGITDDETLERTTLEPRKEPRLDG